MGFIVNNQSKRDMDVDNGVISNIYASESRFVPVSVLNNFKQSNNGDMIEWVKKMCLDACQIKIKKAYNFEDKKQNDKTNDLRMEPLAKLASKRTLFTLKEPLLRVRIITMKKVDKGQLEQDISNLLQELSWLN